MDEHFANKTYIVAGASSGIGRSVCGELSRLGAHLVLIARNQQKLQEALAELSNTERHTAFAFDVSNIEAIENLIDNLYASHSQVAGCVYCVGNGDHAKLRDLTFNRLHAVMLTNYYAYIEIIRCLLKKKPKAQAMSIVGISSLASTSHEKYFTAYAASKAGMEAATRTLATEFCSRNVNINTICPGVVDTERLSFFEGIADDMDSHLKKTGYQPKGLIPPEAVAQLVLYLLSDSAKYITGASLPINGGAAC